MRSQTHLSRVTRLSVLFLPAAFLLAGCNDAISPPAFDPDKAAEAAMTQYDTNHDGYLDAEELNQCPALKNGLVVLDKDKDGRISAAELAEGLRTIHNSRTALMSVAYRVTLNGASLVGATVTLIPEPFLGPKFKPASGTTDERGVVRPKIEGQEMPCVAPGLYRIEVTGAPGQPELPARYNRQTELGQMVGPETRAMNSLALSN